MFPLAGIMNKISCVILFLMMILTMADVFGRKCFDDSILGTVELSEFMLAFVVFFSLAHTEVMDGHVRVDLIMSQFGERKRSAAEMVTQLLCTALSVVVTCASYQYAEKMRAAGEVSQDLWIPKYPFIYLAVLGFAILSVTLFARFLSALARTVKP